MNATNVTIPQADPIPVWRVGAQVGVVAAVATELVGTVARAADVPMRAGNPGAHTATKIALLGFAEPTLMCSAIGTVLAVVFARRARRPAHTFAVTTIVLTAISLISPALAGATSLATKATLVTAHLVAAAIVIPTLIRRLALRPPRVEENQRQEPGVIGPPLGTVAPGGWA
jgi:hypothetical protein